jgi:hypothetical protein
MPFIRVSSSFIVVSLFHYVLIGLIFILRWYLAPGTCCLMRDAFPSVLQYGGTKGESLFGKYYTKD